MLQVFHVDVVKVNRDVTYAAMVIHVCCKRLFQMFQLFRRKLHMFYLGVAYISHLCFKCFIWILHMFSHICCKCFI
jgi:hypothetical protein